jgi:hypothetical protein
MTSRSSPCSVTMTSDLSLRSRQIYPRNHLATSRAILGQANPNCPHFLLSASSGTRYFSPVVVGPAFVDLRRGYGGLTLALQPVRVC